MVLNKAIIKEMILVKQKDLTLTGESLSAAS